MKKIFFRFLLSGFALILTIYIGLFLYYRFAWKNHYSKQQVESLIASINSTPKLTDSFYFLYDKVYKDRHEHITTRYLKQFWTEFLMLKYPLQNNWQLQTAYLQPYKSFRYQVAPWTLAFCINRDVSPEKCFNYIMTERYSKYCKEFKIADTITNLIDKEKIIRFVIANERPQFYRIHPTTFKAEIDSIRNVLTLN
ncbi:MULTISPECIES: hypothetical protein [Niastella]|uniref:Glycosyl transferase family 51 domain-containing protein n=1 Tax=Niastella soli TaxID=2821487 RepID=A0ABS3YZD0_9BACT|nr:hypothetical protein [Niastella soli]MBO9203098.1 hypothetical protein [Niastella soli]